MSSPRSSGRLICIHHRLAGMTGHRYHQALGLLAAAGQRGIEPLLLMHAEADAAVRAALPGRAVLRDPVFRTDLTFDERTAAFAAMLHQHVDAELRGDDRLLLTVATQCEARALAAWAAALPAARRPWTVVVFVSARWNRHGAAERERQLDELRALAADLSRLDRAALWRLIFCTHTSGLREELTALLGVPVHLVPTTELAAGIEPASRRPRAGPPRVALLGGARPEKGSHLLPEIVRESRARVAVDFLLHLANEQLSEDDVSRLCRLAGEPGITVTHGPLDRAAYLSLLGESDLLLFPYDRVAYRQRPSGIFGEAVLAGLPVVVPSGTWMAEQVIAGRAAGFAYQGEGVRPIAEAVADCAGALAALTARARELAPAWRRDQSLDAFLDWIEAEIARRGRGAPGGASGRPLPDLSSFSRRLKASIRAWARG